MTTSDQEVQIEDVLSILGASAAAELRVARNHALNSVPGQEDVVKLRLDPSKTLAVPTSVARALLAAGAALTDD